MTYSFVDCRLDTERCELRRDGTPRHLEPQVFDVLAYLLRHPDRVVSRNELLDEIWGHRYVTPATVDARIKAARQAVGDDGRRQEVIRTIRGRGFRVVVPVTSEVTSADGAAATAELPAAGPRRAPSPHLVPRDREWARLEPSVERALGGVRQTVLISGEAGIGKSTFLEALARHLESLGFRVATGQSIDQGRTGEPYLPILDALARAGRGDEGEPVRDALARFAPTWLRDLPSLCPPALPPAPPSRERMLREIVQALEALAVDRPVALLLEDLHWADRSTLDLVQWTAIRPEAARILVVGTYRSSETDPVFDTILRRVRNSDRCTWIPLEPWGRDEVAAYLAARFPNHAFPPEVAHLAWARGAGNPLFTRSLVDGWIRDGDLAGGDGPWRVETDLDSLGRHLPASLRDAIEQEVARLDPSDQAILETAGVVGRTFRASLVASLLGRDPEQVEARLSELVRRSALVVGAPAAADSPGAVPGRFAFLHDLHREAVYDRIPELRRRRIHGDVGRRLEGEPSAEAGELANHFLRGGDADRAVHHLTRSARHALGRTAVREGTARIELAISVLQANRGLDRALERELELQQMLGPARLELGGWRDPGAEAAYRRAREIAESLGDGDRLAGALYGLAYLYEIRGEYERAQALVRERTALLEDASGDRDLLEMHDQLACSFFHQGRFRESLAHAERALNTGHGAAPQVEELAFGHHPGVSSRYWAGTARWFLGDSDRGLREVQEARDLCWRLDHPSTLAFAETRVARLHQFREEPAAVRARAEAALELSEAGGYPFQRSIATAMLGWALVHDADVAEGLALLREGLKQQREMGALMDYPYGLGLLAEALLAAGRPDEALATAEAGLAAVRDRGGRFFWSAELHRLRGQALTEKGDDEAGQEAFRDALRIAREQEAAPLEARAAEALGRG